jgi:uncharacterized membrane protein
MTNKQSMKTHFIASSILIGVLLLIWAMAKFPVVFFVLLTIGMLGLVYGGIYIFIHNKVDKK